MLLLCKLGLTLVEKFFRSLGTPGSGKSTQCQKIADSFGYAHISKDLLLHEIEAGTERGLKIVEILKNKGTVPDVSVKYFLKRYDSSYLKGTVRDKKTKIVNRIPQIQTPIFPLYSRVRSKNI